MTQSLLKQQIKQQASRREILQRSDLIPPLPSLVTTLLGVLNTSDAETGQLEALLQNDPVLVARMLAMVNSPFYGMNRRIRTIKEAIIVLGARGIRSLVLAAGSTKFLEQDFHWYGHEPKGLWLHSVGVAAGARSIARHCKLTSDQCELAFVGGLLHDIGKLSLVGYLQAAPVVTTEDAMLAYERQVVGLDHAEVGSLVTARWNLASEIQSIIEQHHSEVSRECDASGTDDRTVECVSGECVPVECVPGACVRLADCVAHEIGFGYLPNRAPVQAVAVADLDLVGLDEARWISVRCQAIDAMKAAVVAFEGLSD